MPPVALKLFPFLAWRSRITARTLRMDAIAGLVGALIVLPQGVAYATLAGLLPQYGLYCAIVPAIVAALWGSSWHQISGPTNAMALVVFATFAPLAAPWSNAYIQLVLTLALLVGALQLALGLARLGTLVNFISHTVIVGFAAGAGLLIIAAQLKNFSGVDVPADAHFFSSLRAFAANIRTLNPWICATALVTLVSAVVAKQSFRRLPYMIVAMIVGSGFAYIVGRAEFAAIPSSARLPARLPELSMPSFDPECPAAAGPDHAGIDGRGACASDLGCAHHRRQIGSAHRWQPGIHRPGLVEHRGRIYFLDALVRSLNRCGVNCDWRAQTPLAAVFSAVLLAVALLLVAPLAAYLPLCRHGLRCCSWWRGGSSILRRFAGLREPAAATSSFSWLPSWRR